MTAHRSARLVSAFGERSDTATRHAQGPLSWQTFAACGGRPDLPWTADGVGAWDAETMRTVCAGCPVISECAAYVDHAKVCAGWWAGHDRDPDHDEPPAPTWVPVTAHRHPKPKVEQGALPLGGAA